MAKLVRVCRFNEEENSRNDCQIPIIIDAELKLIMEVPPNEVMEMLPLDPLWDFASYDDFIKQYEKMTVDELASSFVVAQSEVMSFLSKTVPCVGCRQSVEKLYNHIIKTDQPALKPLYIMNSGELTIDSTYFKQPLLLHTFLYCRGSKLNEILEGIPKCKRNRRCLLHSLETHKSKTPIDCWLDVWEALSYKCQEEILTINSDTLLDALENHLRKNRFCTDCKRKVLKAFGILTGDIEPDKVKDYCPSLYEGLRPCPLHKHVHISGDVDFLTGLLEKAEHELSGMRRERHAKSMDTAQEEVLTCLAVFMWERLHHLWQKLKTEEQSWQILYYVGINTLKKSFEVYVEKKLGFSRLERVCEEIFEEEKVKEVKREQKRQKKRARRKDKCKYGGECKGDKQKNTNKDEAKNEVSKCASVATNIEDKRSTVDHELCFCNDNGEGPDDVVESGFHCNDEDMCSEKWLGIECVKSNLCSEEENGACRNGESSLCSNDHLSKGSGESDKLKGVRSNPSSNGVGESSYMILNGCYSKLEDDVCSVSMGASCLLIGSEVPNNSMYERNDFCSQVVKGFSDKNGDSPFNGSCEKRHQKCFVHEDSCHEDYLHHNLPAVDKERDLLLSMGWHCSDTCQDDSFIDIISKEEIEHFKANRKQLSNQRRELRERLREQFNSLSIGVHTSQ